MARIDVGLLFSARDRLSGTLRRLNQNLAKTEKQGKKTARGLKSIDVVMGLMATGTIIALVRGFVKMGSEMEQLRIRIGVFERDMGKVEGVMQTLNDQFGKVPFSLEVIGASFVRLKAAGLDPLDGSLKSLLDGVAAFGGGAQELQRAGVAIQQMAGKGVISMEELRQQLGESIPFAMRVMAQQMKISVAKLISEVERGRLSADEGLGAFFRGLEANFGGLSDALVFTMAGAFERVVKTVQGAADKIFNKFDIGTKIAVILNEVADAIEKFTEGLDAQRVEAFFDAVVDFGKSLFEISKAFGSIIAAVASFVGGVSSIIGADATAIIGVGLVGTILFGPAGGLAALAVASLAIVIENFDAIKKEAAQLDRDFGLFFSPSKFKEVIDKRKIALGLGTGGPGGVSIDLASIPDETSDLAARAAKAKAKINEIISRAGFIAGSAGLGPVGEKEVSKITRAVVNLQAKLKGAGPLPFLQQIERMNLAAANAEEVFLRDAKSIDKLRDALKKAKAEGDDLVVLEGLQTNITQAENSIRDALGLVKELRQGTTDLLAKNLDKVTVKINTSLDKIGAKMSTIRQGLVADFGRTEALARIEQQFVSITAQLDKQLIKAEAVFEVDKQRGAEINRINQKLHEAGLLRDAQIARLKQMKDLESQIFELTNRATNAQKTRDIQETLRQTQRFSDPTSAFFDTSRADQARELREQLEGQVESLRVQAAQIQQNILMNGDVNGVLAKQAGLVDIQIEGLETMRSKVTEVALLQIELWTSVGNTIRSTLGDAIKNLVKGTGTLKEALVSMFDRITDAAADYLAQLIIIKATQAGLGGGFGGGAGGAFGGILGGLFGKGGAIKGGIKPFANGDIVRGPTLFGLAGESGDEAIMPLTRVNGKLGVAAQGGGGGGMNLTIQAIDQQSGAQFLLKHLADIQGGFQQQKALNATGR